MIECRESAEGERRRAIGFVPKLDKLQEQRDEEQTWPS